MGQDYSYTQPSDSEDCYDRYTNSSHNQIEALIHDDEGQSRFPPQPEVECGFPKRCYCGGEPLLDTSYARNDPGRRFFTCENRDDGECHVWKWWDVAAMEEMRAMGTHYNQLAEKVDSVTCSSDYENELEQVKFLQNYTDQKLINLEKIVSDLAKKKARYELVLGVTAIVLVSVGIMLMFY